MNELRVSVATYNQVVFSQPENGITMLALERKATVLKDGSINVRAQPFGGGVRILDSTPLEEMFGKLRFDSERSQQEQDLRILIQPSQWEGVKQYCLKHLANPNDEELESAPDRELVEEFAETMGVELKPSQYMVQAMGFVIEDHPVWAENWYARGLPTVRVYRTFKVQICDETLCKTISDISKQISDQDLEKLALQDSKSGGRGHANSALALPLSSITEAYLALPPELRYRKVNVESHEIDESVLVVMGDVDVPQYQRL